jgi:calcium-dependent protein kinase
LYDLYGDLTEQEVDKIMHAADTDGSGSIDFAEWKAATSKITEQKLKSAFEFFDKDGSGSISV